LSPEEEKLKLVVCREKKTKPKNLLFQDLNYKFIKVNLLAMYLR